MRLLTIVLLLAAAVAPSVAAQWTVGLEWTIHGYGGSSHDTSGTPPTPDARPAGGQGIALRVGRAFGRMGLAVRVGFANPGFTVTGEGISVTDKNTGKLFDGVLVVSTRVGGIGPSGAVRAELGPALHLWDFGGEIRVRLGATGGVAYEWPVARRWTGAVRLETAISTSWFDAAEVPPEFERRPTWRYGLALGIRYRLDLAN